MKKLTNRESHPMDHDSSSFGHTIGKDLTLGLFVSLWAPVGPGT
jgi:hypothetical protein